MLLFSEINKAVQHRAQENLVSSCLLTKYMNCFQVSKNQFGKIGVNFIPLKGSLLRRVIWKSNSLADSYVGLRTSSMTLMGLGDSSDLVCGVLPDVVSCWVKQKLVLSILHFRHLSSRVNVFSNTRDQAVLGCMTITWQRHRSSMNRLI